MSDFDDLLEHTATVQRSALTAGNFGARGSSVWSDLATGVSCSLQALGESERMRGDAILETGTHQMWVASTQDIKGRDRVVIDGVTYEVLGPAGDHSKMSMGMQRFMLRHRERD